MFSGLVTHIGTVREITGNGGRRVQIACPAGGAPETVGASIAVSGICLTAAGLDPATTPRWFEADLSPETLARTNASGWVAGQQVNLERPLRVGDEIGGHLVAGHVDGTATLTHRAAEGEGARFRFAAPADLAPLIATKGSVALDGVSLTVAAAADTQFEVSLIPHTLAVTALGTLAAGVAVNLEIDTLARYVARLQERLHG